MFLGIIQLNEYECVYSQHEDYDMYKLHVMKN